ncbi:MAG: cyanophycinase [Chitinophagales bacterium]|nr:cyanophycinase [Chitinophagales bacterium]MDW8427690.1 cyanophycinase [Chitinophagales bacterium]
MMSLRFCALSIVVSVLACSKPEITLEQADALPETAAKLVTYLTGDATDVTTTTQPGFCLMGGGADVDEAFEWMISRSGGGDFVVIRATGADGYNNYIYYDLGGVNSVETIIIDTKSKAKRQDVYNKIVAAEALFIAGGDQWDYVNKWRNTLTEDAINYLINVKKVPVGGTSAGCAILGEVYFTAKYGTVTSQQAMNNPYRTEVTLGKSDFISIPFLAQTITDTHYDNPDRRGRHVTFMARMVEDWNMNARGIGCEEHTAVCIDENGIAKVYGSGTAHFLKKTNLGPETCDPNVKLTWNRNQQAVTAYLITGTPSGNGSFNLTNWTNYSGGTSYYYYVNNGTFGVN